MGKSSASSAPLEPATGAPDFQNTRLAFQAKDDRHLWRTYWLYRLIDNPFLTKVGPPMLTTALKLGLPVKGIVRNSLFELFCGGETMEETIVTSEALNKFHVKTILDYSVEGEKNIEGFDQTASVIVATLEHGGKHPEVAFSACKITGLAPFELMEKLQAGETLSPEMEAAQERVMKRLHRIAAAARDNRTPVFIDAEESWIQETIDTWAEMLMETYNLDAPWVWTTAQLYRHDRLDYVKAVTERSKQKGYKLGLKLVRGAYMEKERRRASEWGYADPIQPDKASTDRDYDAALAWCIDHAAQVSVCAGTHNEVSTALLVKQMGAHQLSPDDNRVWFSQLLGMSDNLSFNLAHHGYNAAKYLPFGPVKAVMPYLIRRAEENTAVAGQSSREVVLLHAERMRRKQQGN